MTFDGTPIEADSRYYWFDRVYFRIESASWMEKQIDREGAVVWIQGSKIPMSWLRVRRSDAIQDGINYYRGKIHSAELDIANLRALLAEVK